jgi:hypothetical protein
VQVEKTGDILSTNPHEMGAVLKEVTEVSLNDNSSLLSFLDSRLKKF